jgi:hypothetical protein
MNVIGIDKLAFRKEDNRVDGVSGGSGKFNLISMGDFTHKINPGMRFDPGPRIFC